MAWHGAAMICPGMHGVILFVIRHIVARRKHATALLRGVVIPNSSQNEAEIRSVRPQTVQYMERLPLVALALGKQECTHSTRRARDSHMRMATKQIVCAMATVWCMHERAQHMACHGMMLRYTSAWCMHPVVIWWLTQQDPLHSLLQSRTAMYA